jgi:hypothetical protein
LLINGDIDTKGLDTDRIDEEREDFLSGANHRCLSMSKDKMKPQLEMRENPDKTHE